MLVDTAHNISQNMVDWVIDELQFKAEIYHKTGAVSVYNGDVVKSDSAVSESLKEALQSAVSSLEDIPEIHKDYHPGSDGTVVDLVHPSLFPLIFGRSRVLRNDLVGLQNCVEKTGQGEIVPKREKSESGEEDQGYSLNFQWLPCQVEFTGESNVVK